MLLVAPAARAFDFRAQAPTGQWLYYSVIAGTTNVRVVNPDWDTHTPPSGALAIPATVTDDAGTTYNVTEIDARAFRQCDALTAVEVPSGVTSIGQMAFAFCSSLASVTLPDGLTQIGIAAFSDCAFYNNTDNWQDDGMLYLGHYLIRALPSLTGTIAVADGTMGTANGAFENCRQAERIVLPESIVMIGSIAFQNCLSMDTLEILATAPPTLGANAFLSLEEFAVLVPCHSADTYATASGWSGLDIVEHCPGDEPGVGIENPEHPLLAACATAGGVIIDCADGTVVTLSDAMGRRVTESCGGYVALPAHGVYIATVQGAKAIKIIY